MEENQELAIPNEIIGRGITDPEFRERFLKDPQQALTDEGYALKLSQDQLDAVKELDEGIIDFAIHGIHRGRPQIMA